MIWSSESGYVITGKADHIDTGSLASDNRIDDCFPHEDDIGISGAG
jgi:hypothetical protein